MKKITKVVPGYIYKRKISESSLCQGDVLKVDGQFRHYFREFYPAINYPENTDKYVMVLTQSCDLVKNAGRKPKLSHINVCLVRSLKAVVERIIIDEIKPIIIGDKNIAQKADLDKLKDKLYKLLNNTDQKTHFFLPKKLPFKEDMVALLSLSFSFRIDHYDLLLQSRVLGLEPEFRAKVGHTISQLYGRIGTRDLADYGWDEKGKDYVKNLLRNFNLVEVKDKSFIDYIKSNLKNNFLSIEELIEECRALKVEKSFQPLKNELMQNIKNQLIKLFENKDKISALTKMDKVNLSKEIQKFLQSMAKSNLLLGSMGKN